MNATMDEAPAMVRVWDLPTRLVHWSLLAMFVGAWLTREGDGQRMLHLLFGYSLFGLVLFRIVWGFIGSRHARFADFVRGPGAAMGYLRGRVARVVGHNPAGAAAIILFLLFGLGSGITGWWMASGRGESVEELHELFANGFLALAVMHVLGVLWSGWRHRENLVRGMIDGRKRGAGSDAIGSNRPLAALLLLAALGGFWAWGWQRPQLPFGLSAGVEQEEGEGHGAGGIEREHHDEDGDDD